MKDFVLFLSHCNPLHIFTEFTSEEIIPSLIFKIQQNDLTIQEKNRIALLVTCVISKDKTIRSNYPNLDSSIPQDILIILEEQTAVFFKISKEGPIKDVDGYSRYGDVDYVHIPFGKYESYYKRSTKIREQFPKYWETIHRNYLSMEAVRLLEEVDGDDKCKMIDIVKNSGIIPSEINITNDNIFYLCIIPREVAMFHLGFNLTKKKFSESDYTSLINSISEGAMEEIQMTNEKNITENGKYNMGNDENSNCVKITMFPELDVFSYITNNTVYSFSRDEYEGIIKNGKHIYTGETLPKYIIELIKSRQQFSSMITPVKPVTIQQFYKTILSRASEYCKSPTSGASGNQMMQMQEMMSSMMGGSMGGMPGMPDMSAMMSGSPMVGGSPEGCTIC